MLDKKDFTQIKEIVKEVVSDEINKFAGIVSKSFDNTEKRMGERFTQIDDRFTQIENRLTQIELEITAMKSDIKNIYYELSKIKQELSEIKEHFVYRHELEDAESRIKLCEIKLGIESGK